MITLFKKQYKSKKIFLNHGIIRFGIVAIRLRTLLQIAQPHRHRLTKPLSTKKKKQSNKVISALILLQWLSLLAARQRALAHYALAIK